jgi:hypothetical protein
MALVGLLQARPDRDLSVLAGVDFPGSQGMSEVNFGANGMMIGSDGMDTFLGVS